MANCIILFIVATIQLIVGQSLIGYDCSKKGLTISRMSILDVGECNVAKPDVKTESQKIFLLQSKKYTPVHVKQCKVNIHRIVTHCGMFSHSSPVPGGVLDYLDDVTQEQCALMHSTGVTKIGYNTVLTGLIRNGTVYKSVTLAGKISQGSCQGVEYNDNIVSYSNVVVQASVTITLTDYIAKTDRQKDVVRLSSGMSCKLSRRSCIDNIGGHTFWDLVQYDDWNLDTFDILYKGNATKSSDSKNPGRPLYTVATPEATFSILTEGSMNYRGRTLMKTEHHRLFVLEMNTETVDIHREERPLVENIEMFTYVNAKVVYVERHIRQQLKSLYYDVIYHKCTLERKILKSLLTLVLVKPDEFAYNLMDKPGYMAVVTGEIARIIKCTPVEVKVRRLENCYTELPVSRGNVSLFLTPKTHILLRKGTEILCDGTIPSTFMIGENWYEITPKAHRVEPPEIMEPSANLTWNYEDPGNLAKTGIYTQQELENLEDRILFPLEQPAVLNTLAHSATGRKISTEGISIEGLLDPDTIDKIVNSYWDRAWTKFSMFGNTVAGLIGIYVVIRTIKAMIDTALHACILKDAFGWSFKLLGAVLSSITHYLLRKEERVQQEYMETPSELESLHSVRIESEKEQVEERNN